MKFPFFPNALFIFGLILAGMNSVGESRKQKYPIPYALSPVYLQYLENVEAKFYNFLRNMDLAELKYDLEDVIESYLRDLEERTGISKTKMLMSNATNFSMSNNPILSLEMINRFVNYGNMMHLVAPDIIHPDTFPGEHQISYLLEAVLRLQHVYDLDALELSNGVLYGIPTNASLSFGVCFQLGRFAEKQNHFALALQWYDAALHKLKSVDFQGDLGEILVWEEHIVNSIRVTINRHNMELLYLFRTTGQIKNWDGFSTPISSLSFSANSQLTQRKRLVQEYSGQRDDVRENPNSPQILEANQLLLCEGTNLQPEELKKDLKCHLDTSRHPYWTVNPLKIEVLSEVPQIIQIYDIISDLEIETLKKRSRCQLEKAPRPPGSTYRTAGYAWLDDNMLPDGNFLKRIEFITGFNVMGGEEKGVADRLQVAAYTFGGHVAPHLDSFSQRLHLTRDRGSREASNDARMGHRIATFLVYLNDVEVGGRTVFPLVGVSIKPVKGAAVLWHTNYRNGGLDNKLLHLACPVVKGHKWIATKWIRSNANVFQYPCGLTPNV